MSWSSIASVCPGRLKIMSTFSVGNTPRAAARRARISAPLPYFSSRSIPASSPSSKLCTPTEQRVTPASRYRLSTSGSRWFGLVSIEIVCTGDRSRISRSVASSSSGFTVGVPPPTYTSLKRKPAS